MDPLFVVYPNCKNGYLNSINTNDASKIETDPHLKQKNQGII